MATCVDCNNPVYSGVQHQCPNRTNMFRMSADLFRIPEGIQKVRYRWWKWRNKWGSSRGPNINHPGAQP